MAQILQEKIFPAGEMGLWEIEEPEAFFLEQLRLDANEAEQLAGIRGKKRLEWLAVRQLVHVMTGLDRRMPFLKDAWGKPHLTGSGREVSISHSGHLAAAILAPVPTGIDIQFPVARITRIAPRFLRPEELDSVSPQDEVMHLHVFWGAKESLYKAYGRRGLDFCKHMYITPFAYQPEGGRCHGQVRTDTLVAHYDIHYREEAGAMLVYALETRRFVYEPQAVE